MIEFMQAAGGIALLLFAIRFLRKGLDRLIGERLDVWLGRVAGGPVRSVLAGAGLGVVVPSSTSLSLLTVSLVKDERLSLHRAMALILGAFIGITLTVHLIAINIFHYAPILALFGVLLFQGTNRESWRAVGQIILAVAFLFFGVGVIADSTKVLAATKELPQLLEMAASNPLLLAVLAAALTVAAQSSTATIAVLVALGITDERLMTDSVALPFIVGANCGLAATLTIAGWTQAESRRLGLGVLLCRVIVAGAVIYTLPLPVEWMQKIPFGLAGRIAMAHTAFNVVCAFALLPLLKPIALFVTALTGNGAREPGTTALKMTRWPDDPAVALTQSKREIGIVCREIVDMLQDAWDALKTGDENIVRQIRKRDDQVDRLDRQIKRFLTQQLAADLSVELDKDRDRQLRFLTDLETIGDVIDRNIVGAAVKKTRKGVRFSEAGWEEIKSYFRGTQATLELASAVFMSNSQDMARKLLEHKTRMRDEEIRLRETHYDRLQRGGQQTLETTELHLELLSQLKHINHVVSGVAYGVLNGSLEANPLQLRPGLHAAI